MPALTSLHLISFFVICEKCVCVCEIGIKQRLIGSAKVMELVENLLDILLYIVLIKITAVILHIYTSKKLKKYESIFSNFKKCFGLL